jgi:hypothetical protein
MESRGGILGAFNTENQEGPSYLLLHLSMADETDSSKEICTDAFTTEQMRKLGSVELYNTFKKMNL